MSSHTAPNLKDTTGLPEFVSPPVEEVALSLQFGAIQGLGVPHFGVYWQAIREDFPDFEVQPPIANLTEELGPRSPHIQRIGIELLTAPDVRCWFLDKTGTRLLQMQKDRFVSNWRRVTGTETYPRYPVLRERLEAEWRRFCAFLDGEKLPRPRMTQCEVTYVNHIEYRKGWNGYGELGKVIESYSTPAAKKFLPSPERVSMQVVYPLENSAGRLHVSFVPVIRARDGEEVLQMTLTARGAPRGPSDADAVAWLDLGRKWVVRGFADFTTETMHNVWGKK